MDSKNSQDENNSSSFLANESGPSKKRKLLEKVQAEIDSLENKNIALTNENQVLKNLVDEYKKKIEELEKSQSKYMLLKQVITDNSGIDISLLSCKSNKILEVQKTEGIENGINFYLTCKESEAPYFVKNQDFINRCFKMNLTGEFVIKDCCKNFNEIISRVNLCRLNKIHICNQKIKFDHFLKLVAFKQIKICILKKITVIDDNFSSNDIHKLLKELPSIEEFEYEFVDGVNLFEAAQNLSQLQPFRNLQKFKLSNLHYTFKLGDFAVFIIKNINACYVLQFQDPNGKLQQQYIEKSETKLMDLLKFFNCNLSIKYKKI